MKSLLDLFRKIQFIIEVQRKRERKKIVDKKGHRSKDYNEDL